MTSTSATNLYHLYLEKTEGLSNEFKKALADELTKAYRELYYDNLRYLVPDDFVVPDDFEMDDEDIRAINKPNLTLRDSVFLYNIDSTHGWTEKQQKEINQILSSVNLVNNAKEQSLNSTNKTEYITLYLKTTQKELKGLLKALKEGNLICRNTKLHQLEYALSFSSKEKPHIVLLNKQRQLLSFLLLKLGLNKGEYNKHIYTSEIFIQEDKTLIKDIRKQVSKCGKLTDRELLEKPAIRKLYNELIGVFKKENLIELPLEEKD